MSSSRQEVRAEAKATKARAKAMRPWYRKKRTWLGGIIGLIVLVSIISAATSGSQSSNTNAATSGAGSVTAVSSLSNNDAYPPPQDVTITGCSGPDQFGAVTVTGTILNHSPKTSDYIIQGTLEDSTGAHVGDWDDAENNIAANQSANFSTETTASNPKGAVTCKVASVDRTASYG